MRCALDEVRGDVIMPVFYADASALFKLVREETQSSALRLLGSVNWSLTGRELRARRGMACRHLLLERARSDGALALDQAPL